MIIPKNYKDPGHDEEQEKYHDPVLSRLGILDILKRNDHSIPMAQWRKIYKDSEDKSTALEFRIKAMVRDGQLILVHDIVYSLEYWPIQEGQVLKKADGLYVQFEHDEQLWPLYRNLPDQVFPGDFSWFAKIQSTNQAAFYDLIDGVPVFLEGQIEDPNLYDLPKGYEFAIKVTDGPYRGQVITARSLENKTFKKFEKVFCQLDRTDRSEYVIADIIRPDYPKGIRHVIRNHVLPWKWSHEVSQEANEFLNAKITKSKHRVDLTDLPFVTIDGATAKDFDDAVYAHIHGDASATLYVAIADVAHYVKEGSAIDQEAVNRGVSVYFPKYVIPMLPEILSNDLCSLKPKVNRYALVCKMELSSEGQIKSFQFFPGIIKSKARLTYEEVEYKKYPESLSADLASLWAVYDRLLKVRKKNGYVSFVQHSTDFEIDENEIVAKMKRTASLKSHRLIEEMMLAANRCAAEFLFQNGPEGVYRIHDEPSAEKVQALNDLVRPLNLGLKKPYTLNKIAKLSSELQQQHPRLAVMISRIMQRASYQIDPSRHYGLNFDLYSHFTSPIRRYPDLIVHRLIYAILEKKPIKAGHYSEHLEKINVLERRAEEAERAYHSYLKVKFAPTLSGQKLKAMVVGLAEFGVFVELEDYPIDGMIHVSNLGCSYWIMDCGSGVLTDGNHEIRIGDMMMVRLLGTDLQSLKINFSLVEFIKKKKNIETNKENKKESKKESKKENNKENNKENT